MYGLCFCYRPIEDIIREIEHIEERVILLNDADFFALRNGPCRSCRPLSGAAEMAGGGKQPRCER